MSRIIGERLSSGPEERSGSRSRGEHIDDASRPVDVETTFESTPHCLTIANNDTGRKAFADYAVLMSKYLRLAEYVWESNSGQTPGELKERFSILVNENSEEIANIVPGEDNERRVRDAVAVWLAAVEEGSTEPVSLWDATGQYQGFRDLLFDKRNGFYAPRNSRETEIVVDSRDRNRLRIFADSRNSQKDILEDLAYVWAIEESGVEEYINAAEIALSYDLLYTDETALPQIVIDTDDISSIIGCKLTAEIVAKACAGEDGWDSGIVVSRPSQASNAYLVNITAQEAQESTKYSGFVVAADYVMTPDGKQYVFLTVDSSDGLHGKVRLDIRPYEQYDTDELMSYFLLDIPMRASGLRPDRHFGNPSV